MDEILVAQVLPRRGRVEVARGGGKGAHPLHRDAAARRAPSGEAGASSSATSISRRTRSTSGRSARTLTADLGIAQRGDELGTQGVVGHLEAGGPAAREFQTEIGQRLEREARVGRGVAPRRAGHSSGPSRRLTQTAAHGRRTLPSGSSTQARARTTPPCQTSSDRRGSRLKRAISKDEIGGIGVDGDYCIR